MDFLKNNLALLRLKKASQPLKHANSGQSQINKEFKKIFFSPRL